jgi:DNA replication protein DnaT
MADFWIKLEKNTPDKPEIFEMAEILAIDPDAVLGKLIRVWCWVDSNSSDGHIKSVTPVLIDRLTMSQGFADAMTRVGWLKENSIPNFNRHLGESAKKRAKDSERKRMSRVPSEDSHKKTVTESGLDKIRVDKSRLDKTLDIGEKKKKTIFTPPTEEQINNIFIEVGMPQDNGAEARRYIDYYAQQGWKLSNGNKMVDWKAAAKNWLRNQQKWNNQK